LDLATAQKKKEGKTDAKRSIKEVVEEELNFFKPKDPFAKKKDKNKTKTEEEKEEQPQQPLQEKEGKKKNAIAATVTPSLKQRPSSSLCSLCSLCLFHDRWVGLTQQKQSSSSSSNIIRRNGQEQKETKRDGLS